MTTNKAVRQALHTSLVALFTSPPAGYTVPIDTDNIKRYTTAPDDTSDSPNWLIISGIGSGSEAATINDDGQNPRFALILMSRIQAGDETGKEAAEDWIDDAEEMMLEHLQASVNQANWSYVKILTPPKRDPDRTLWGFYRTSQIFVEVVKR